MSRVWIPVVMAVILVGCFALGCGGGSEGSSTLDATTADTVAEADGVEMDVREADGGQAVSAANGGTVEGPGGVVLEIPGGALAEDTAIAIEVSDTPPEFDGIPVGDIYRFLPAGLEFQAPVTLTLPYDPEKVSGGVADLRIWWADDESGPFTALPGWLDAETATVTSEITHFSVGVVATFLDPTGEAFVEWSKHWRPDDIKLDESYRFGAVETSDGGFVLSNYGLDLAYEAGFWVTAKYSKGGQLLWTDVLPTADLPAPFSDVTVREMEGGDLLLCGEDIQVTRILDVNGQPKVDFAEVEHTDNFYVTDCWPRAGGGVLYVGHGTDDDSGSEGLLIKALDAAGAELWDVVPGPLKGLYASDARMAVSASGRVYAAATHHLPDTMDSEIIVGSVDENGLGEWGQVWSSEAPRNQFAGLELAGDILYVAGLTHSGEGPQHDAAALVAFKEGELLWQETKDGGEDHRFVGSASVFSTAQGHPLLATYSDSDLGPGMGQIHLWKFTPAGQESFEFSATSYGDIRSGISVATDASDAAYLTMTFYAWGVNALYRTLKIDTTGAFQWSIDTGTPLPTRWAGAHRTFALDGSVFVASVAHDDGAIGFDNDGRFYMIRYGQK